MALELIVNALETSSQDAVDAMLQDEQTVFWVDWREEEEQIINDCETVLQTGQLRGEFVKSDADGKFAVYIHYRDHRIRIPLTYSADDRHIALCTLNKALHPDYEIRLCKDGADGDTVAFVPLDCGLWAELEKQYGSAVHKHFYRLTDRPNVFTEHTPF